MLHYINKDAVEKIPELKEVIEKYQLLQSPFKLSKLVVTEGYQIILPDYNNLKIKMAPLPKALFIFYLNHPEGVALHDLSEHKAELLNIYRHVSSRQDDEAVRKSIDTLVDMQEPFINENCSKIRAAFRKVMDEHIAKHYYTVRNRLTVHSTPDKY